MSRPLRIHAPGMLYHVFARGNDKQCIYMDDSDCRAFQELLAEALLRFDVKCVAYCLMWNHYHLLLRVGAVAVSRLMQQLNSSYCQRFNRRRGRVGHVLQGRFGSRIVEDGAYARTVLRYLALNPVTAGLVSRPGDWRWSSYRFAVGVGEDECPDFVSFEDVWWAFGTSDPDVGRSRFADFVAAGLEEVFSNPLLHGSDRLRELATPLLKPHETTHEHPHEQRHATRPALGSLFDGRFSQAELDDAAHAAFVDHAYTLEEIGRAVSRHPSVVCRWIRRAKQRRREAGRDLSGGQSCKKQDLTLTGERRIPGTTCQSRRRHDGTAGAATAAGLAPGSSGFRRRARRE